MKRSSLEAFLENHSQLSVAQAVGISQGAVSKMLRTGRNITVVEHDDGRLELVEEKPILGSAQKLQKTA